MDGTSADAARRELLDFTRCPACRTPLASPRCTRCGLDLAGTGGARIAEASRAAVRALDDRQRVVDAVRAGVPLAGAPGPAAPAGAAPPAAAPPATAQPAAAPLVPRHDRSPLAPPYAGSPAPVAVPLPGGPVPYPAGPSGPAPGPRMPVGAAVPGTPVPGYPPHPGPALAAGRPPFAAGPGHPGGPARPAYAPPVPPRAERSFDATRLFALAGAGLVAAAALVFAFFVLDEQPLARVLVLLLATGLAATGALLLRRTGVGSSAEAVGGLVAALCVVDAWVTADLADGRMRWLVLASLLVAIGLGVPAAGLALRLRSWTVLVLVLPAVPLCLAAASGTAWGLQLGLQAAALVTLVRVGYRRQVAARLGGSTVAVDVLLTVSAVGLLVVAVLQGFVPTSPVTGWESGGLAIALLLGAVVASAQAQAGGAPAWTGTAAALAVLSGAVAVASVAPEALGVAALAAAAVWALLVVVPARRTGTPPAAAGTPDVDLDDRAARYHARVTGGWVALVAVTVPGVVAGLFAQLALLDGLDHRLPETIATDAYATPGALGTGVGPVLAVVVLAGALAAGSRLRLAPLPASLPPVPLPAAGAPGTPTPADPHPLAYPAGARPGPTGERTPAVVALGRACLPAATVVAVVVAAGLLRRWSVPLLLAELVVAVALVEVARRIPPRSRAAAPTAPTALPPAGPPAPGVPGAPVAPGGPGAPAVVPAPPARLAGLLAGSPWRGTLTLLAVVQVSFLGLLTWASRPTLALGAAAVVVLVLRARRLVVAELRGVLVGVATAYGALVPAVLLGTAGWDGFGVVGLVAVTLLGLSALLTVVPRVRTDTWLGVLTVAVVPAVLGIAAVAVDRTWWGAGVAAALLLVEALLLGTSTRPVPAWLRVGAAALLLPTAAVVVICAGAVLLPGSGSPVLLPLVAVLAAASALAAPAVADRVARHTGIGPAGARVALESAAAATAGVALLLGLGRPATGADTVLVLCAVLGAGASAVAGRPDRRPIWWVASVLWSGVLWTALVWWGVSLVEAFTAPPAAAAVLVGTLLARRTERWRALVGSGAALLVAPTLLLTLAGRDVGVRAGALLALAAVTVALGLLADRTARRPAGEPAWLRALTGPLLVAGGAAALAGAIRAAHLAVGTPAGSGVDNARLFGAALVWSLLGSVLLGAAGLLLASRHERSTAALPDPAAVAAVPAAVLRRWALAPAIVVGTVGALSAARPSWALTWTGWVVELGVLALAVLAVRAEARRETGALATAVPPGWALWCVALAWAIGAWSPRELRVEVFALPLGLALTAMGAFALHATLSAPPATGAGPATPPSPPPGRWAGRGSVVTLTPGVLATLGPSMLAIWTDPLTWRAILVVVLALGFMLVGARQLLRAPLVVGAAALPVAVLSVFAAQIGRTISAGPWLLTLLAAGGLLLVLAIFAERRKVTAGDGATPAAPRVLR